MPVIPSRVKSGVYKILNKLNGKVYVGSSAQCVHRRMRNHRRALKRGTHDNIHLQRSWNKNGPDAFLFVVIEGCSPERCVEREQFWIDHYQAADMVHGYNRSPTAGSTLGFQATPQQRASRSAQYKNMAQRPDYKQQLVRMNQVRTAKYKGVPYDQTTKDKIAARTKERMADPAVQAKMRAAWVRRKQRMDAEGWNRGANGQFIKTYRNTRQPELF